VRTWEEEERITFSYRPGHDVGLFVRVLEVSDDDGAENVLFQH